MHTEEKIEKYIYEYYTAENDENCFFRLEENNLMGKRCGYISTPETFDESDRGLPIFSDGLLEGVVLVPQMKDGPIIYEELSKHRKFLEKYLNNSAEPGKPKKEGKAKEVKKTDEKKSKKEETKPKKEEEKTIKEKTHGKKHE